MRLSSVSTTASRSCVWYSSTCACSSAGISTALPSRWPSGLMYAHMWRRSTMPVSSCSAPIGRWMATQCSLSCSCSAPSTRKKSARSRSSMFTKRTRERFPSAARVQLRAVCTSTPITPLTTNSAPSTTRRAAIASPTKPASPGVSIRLILRPCHSAWQTLAASDMFRRCSSSSQSETVDPASIVPSRFVAPAWNSIASTSDVFPVPRCPTTATLRIFPGSWAMHPPRLWCSVWPIDDLSDSPAAADAVRGTAEIAILNRAEWTENVYARCASGSHFSPQPLQSRWPSRSQRLRPRSSGRRSTSARTSRRGRAGTPITATAAAPGGSTTRPSGREATTHA